MEALCYSVVKCPVGHRKSAALKCEKGTCGSIQTFRGRNKASVLSQLKKSSKQKEVAGDK